MLTKNVAVELYNFHLDFAAGEISHGEAVFHIDEVNISHPQGISLNMRLEFELVPDSCWHSNLRSLLSKAQWDFIRRDAYARAGGRCMICSSPAKPLEAHEQWEYDEKNGVQKLKDVIAVCRSCHEVIHIGRTTLLGGEERAAAHFMKVNGCSYAEYRKALGKANEDHRRRNEISEWKLDLGWLKTFIK